LIFHDFLHPKIKEALGGRDLCVCDFGDSSSFSDELLCDIELCKKGLMFFAPESQSLRRTS